MNLVEMALIFVLAYLLFGPKKASELAQQAGDTLAKFKRTADELQANLMMEMSMPPEARPDREIDALRQTIVGALSPLMTVHAEDVTTANVGAGADSSALRANVALPQLNEKNCL